MRLGIVLPRLQPLGERFGLLPSRSGLFMKKAAAAGRWCPCRCSLVLFGFGKSKSASVPIQLAPADEAVDGAAAVIRHPCSLLRRSAYLRSRVARVTARNESRIASASSRRRLARQSRRFSGSTATSFALFRAQLVVAESIISRCSFFNDQSSRSSGKPDNRAVRDDSGDRPAGRSCWACAPGPVRNGAARCGSQSPAR